MGGALPTPFARRLERLYAEMDAAYAAAAGAYGFVCRGCEESCCRTRFHHHTLIEAAFLREGFEGLAAGRRHEVLAAARAGEAGRQPLCPLFADGRCGLYPHRPMICRLHGIPHEVRFPGQGARLGPGCAEFDRRCGGTAYRPFDRSPLYAALARLEAEFQAALGVRRRIRMTIAEILLDPTLAGRP
jgi:Fe-S-cluster containining protein